MELTYTTNDDGRKTAPDGTVLTPGMADAVDKLAYLQGWASTVLPPDLGGEEPVRLFAFTTGPNATEDHLRDLVRVCDLYGIEHEVSDRFNWVLNLRFGTVSMNIEARKSDTNAKPTPQPTAKDLLLR